MISPSCAMKAGGTGREAHPVHSAHQGSKCATVASKYRTIKVGAVFCVGPLHVCDDSELEQRLHERLGHCSGRGGGQGADRCD